jgi:hypothetical protein
MPAIKEKASAGCAEAGRTRGLLGNLPQSVGNRPSCCRIEQPQSAADLDGMYSPAVAGHDAAPGHIANGFIVVAGVTVGIVISQAPVTETKAAMTEATMMEAAAMESAMTATSAMTSAAMTSAAVGEGSRAGCAEQDSRCPDNTEAANGEQSHGRQTARQDVAVARAVLDH